MRSRTASAGGPACKQRGWRGDARTGSLASSNPCSDSVGGRAEGQPVTQVTLVRKCNRNLGFCRDLTLRRCSDRVVAIAYLRNSPPARRSRSPLAWPAEISAPGDPAQRSEKQPGRGDKRAGQPAADEFTASKPAHTHERFALESPDEREAFLFGKTREKLKARKLLPQLRRLDSDDATRSHGLARNCAGECSTEG